jgi:hypothetical protein
MYAESAGDEFRARVRHVASLPNTCILILLANTSPSVSRTSNSASSIDDNVYINHSYAYHRFHLGHDLAGLFLLVFLVVFMLYHRFLCGSH